LRIDFINASIAFLNSLRNIETFSF